MSTFIRYGLVGVVNTALGLGAMAGLAAAGAHYTVYTSTGYVLAFLASYTLNGLFTFRAGPVSPQGFARFALVNGALLLLVQAAQGLAVEVVGTGELPAVAMGAVLYLAAGFSLNRSIVFRPA